MLGYGSKWFRQSRVALLSSICDFHVWIQIRYTIFFLITWKLGGWEKEIKKHILIPFKKEKTWWKSSTHFFSFLLKCPHPNSCKLKNIVFNLVNHEASYNCYYGKIEDKILMEKQFVKELLIKKPAQ